jgi:hypothetical protein
VVDSKASNPALAAAAQVIRHLITAADADTAYRDLYLRRAAERLDPSLSRAQYEQLKEQPAILEHLLEESRKAVARQDWARVQELAGRAAGVRSLMEDKQAELEIAELVYGAAEVIIDPFSSVFDVLLGKTGQAKAGLRDELVAALNALEKTDGDWSSLYAGRRGYFAGLSISAGEPTTGKATKGDVGQLQRRAVEAAEHGNVEELRRIAQEMLKTRATTEAASPTAERKASGGPLATYPPALGEPFPREALERGRALGLAQVEAQIQAPAWLRAVQETIERYGWHPSFLPSETAKDGQIHLRPLLAQEKVALDLVEPLLETTSMFLLHPFVNSGGVRYFPLFPDREFVLLEEFPEDAVPAESSGLLAALGLTRRSGLSRGEIERRLWERGARVLGDRLGLDPTKFRLLCIPYDLYVRIGQERGWGKQPRWTHVDGYQLLKGGRLRALVAGDARFGGLYDLCSISEGDEREGVLARFAVVHRERLTVR